LEGDPVIEQLAAQDDRGEASLVIRPNRALSQRHVIAAFALVAMASGSVALFSWLQGNVFAPLFALLELALLALCLRLVWLAGERFEVVAIGPGGVSVRRPPAVDEAFRAHPQWVRLKQQEGRVLLVSRDREIEVGACLGEAERQSLALRLRNMIGAVVLGRTSEPAGAP
jgi:uncharacterized membrane protein